jgi:putative transposase
MARVNYTAEESVLKMREIDVLIGQGKTSAEACKQVQVSKDTYYRWRKEYGGMQIDQVKKLKELEKENARLKKIVADLTIDNSILKEVSKGNF